MTRWEKLLAFLKGFIKEHICLVFICVVFYAFYRNIVGAASVVICAILAFAIVYGSIITLCWFGMNRFMQHIRGNTLTPKRRFWLSLLVGLPVYFIWLLLSLIPVTRLELWVMIAPPILLLTAGTLATISEYWTGKRIPFWGLQFGIAIILMAGGQVTVNLLLP